MMNSDLNRQEWHRLFGAALNDTLSAEEKVQLSDLLKSSAEARQLWFLYSDNECGLAELKSFQASPAAMFSAKNAVSTPAGYVPGRSRPRWTWSPLTAAAAGVVFGLFSASMVWGYVGTMASRVVTVLAESFEKGAAPKVTGLPVTAEEWSGDFSEVVGPFQGVQPADGRQMLRFRRADYEGKPVRDGYVADLYRIVDLRGVGFGVAGGETALAISARFAALPQDDLRGLNYGVTLYALDALPPAGMRDDTFLRRVSAGIVETSEPESEPRILASASRSEKGMNDGQTWWSVRSELKLPVETRYCLIHLRAHLSSSYRPETPKPVEFAGLFLDDIRVTLTRPSSRL